VDVYLLVALAASMALNKAILMEHAEASAQDSLTTTSRSKGREKAGSCVVSGITPSQYFIHKFRTLKKKFTRKLINYCEKKDF
jgi:hypothetical protein